MAKTPRAKKTPVTDRSMFFSDLTSLDPSKKNEVWFAQYLMFMKRSGGSQLFLDPVKAKRYREMDLLIVNDKDLRQMVDPVTPMGAGGEAKYFAADYKACPIYIHLQNITRADIQKTGKQIEVDLTDRYAKTRKMNDNYKIIYQNYFRELINYLSEQIGPGLPKLHKDQDPYKWAENLMKKDGDKTVKPDAVNSFLEQIKMQITDSQDMALYNEFIYKGDYEHAFELGIQYYIFNLNKWDLRYSDEALNDIRHFNKFCGEYYTDLITGRPVIERWVPETLWTSKFKRKDGEDIMYYWREWDVTFGDFFRMMGKNLSPQKLREVFELNKQRGFHSVGWQDAFYNFDALNFTRDNATIRIGKAACLSTDMEAQMEDLSDADNPVYKNVPLSWEPMNENQNKIEKRYNVWRWAYYIPPTMLQINNADYAWQSQFVFELQTFQDQQRYGDNGRYAKSPLVIYDNSSQATFSDIVADFMPKINIAWAHYQNCLVNDIDAVIFSDDFIGGLLNAVDESNKIVAGDPQRPTAGGNGQDAYMESWRMIQQSGKGFMKMRDKNGTPLIDPGKLVLTVKNGYLDKAEKYMAQMLILYDMMIKSLAFAPLTAGEEVKPRTPVAALEETLKASDSSKFIMQKGYEEVIKMFGERIVRYILSIFIEKDKYKFPQRYDEFMDTIGYANGLSLEGLKDIDPESIGLTVNYVDNTAKKEFIMQLALQYVRTKELDEDFLDMLLGIDNWKYAFVLMRMSLKKKKKELQQQAIEQHQREMELKEADLRIAMALQNNQSQNDQKEIITEGQVKDMINKNLNLEKFKTQWALKQKTGAQKMVENAQKAELEKDIKNTEKNLEDQSALAVK